MKVSRPDAAPVLSPGQEEQEGRESVSMKVSPRPPAPEAPVPAMQPRVTPIPEKEVVAEVSEKPAAPVSMPRVEVSPKPAAPQEMPEMKIGAGDVGEEPETPEEGVEVATITEHYRYIRGAKPNPFRPLTDKPDAPPPIVEQESPGVTVAGPRPPKPSSGPITPIEKYPLNSLDLVAIMRMKQEALALVQIPDGNKGFIIRRGTLIGSEGGHVVEIDLQGNKVVVELEEEDMFGNITINKRQLSLQKTAGDF
ncbi:MAG: pilus assembly protein PilP [Desulfatibacillum sp.]|nr:pilus assembly protein PilP [Desulfatibacillum sp.]